MKKTLALNELKKLISSRFEEMLADTVNDIPQKIGTWEIKPAT